MSFRDFTFPDVVTRLGLNLTSTQMFPHPPSVPVATDFQRRLDKGATLALGIDNEKARSEFVIAQILIEFCLLSESRHAVFSGPEFNVDPAAGLNGFCDFLITRGPEVMILTAPVMMVAEAKNDNVNTGLGQCIAGMRAAWLFNQSKGATAERIFGAATTGTVWKFLQLRDTEVTVDQGEYHVRDVGTILGILLHMAATA